MTALGKYISEYGVGFDFKPTEKISYELHGAKISLDVMLFQDLSNRRQKATAVIEKNGNKYECELVDSHNWSRVFSFITLNGKPYFCFRKTLYGFTLLNADTLVEEYDYFPENVIDGGESFIIVGVGIIGDIIIFDGCYWAYPYGWFAYDHTQKKFLNLNDEYGIRNNDKTEINGDTLRLIGTDEEFKPVEATATLDEIRRLLKDKGRSGFYDDMFGFCDTEKQFR